MSATTLSNSSTRNQSVAQSSPTIWQWLVGGLGVVTILAFVIYLFTAIAFLNRPFIGAMVSHTMIINAGQQTGNEAWPATTGEDKLRRGDQLIAINGEALFPTEARTDFSTAFANYNNTLNNLTSNIAPIELTFLRDDGSAPYCESATGAMATCTLTVTPLSNFPGVDFLAYFIMPYIGGLILLGLGLLVAYYRFNTPQGIIAAAIAFSSAIYTGGMFDIGTQATLAPLWSLSACFAGASMAVLGMTFPKRLKVARQLKYLEYFVLFSMSGLGVFLAVQYFTTTDPVLHVNTLTPASTAIGILGILAMWVLSLFQQSSAITPATRDQANTLVIGSTLMLVPVALWIVSRSVTINGTTIVPFNLEAIIILNIFPVAAIAYAVLQYRRFNTERIISDSVTYTIMIGALVLAMFLLALGASLLSIDIFNAATNPFLISVILFVMVLGFTPVRNRLQTRIDKIYYRQQRNLQEKVQEFSRKLATMNDYQAIVSVFEDTLEETLSPQNTHIFLRDPIVGDFRAQQTNASTTDVRFTADSPMIEVLQADDNDVLVLEDGTQWHHALRVDQARLRLLKTMVIASLKGSDQLNGFVLLSAPKKKTSYNHEEVDFLGDVVSQLAIATERSQVIGTLRQRVQELDVLSQVGQAVNFTIELDDLLELIYNQTSKLVPVPNFYIVLYEEDINRLYFAFFLEGDDRFENKERKRWVVGQDIFSQIIKDNSATRLANFSNEMRKRGAELELLDTGLLSFMGVPLVAGRRTVGVMAAGKRRDQSEYTDDQFKIFSDVAALAATSLDKASLFNQSRFREKQLTILNDISRQLVATETDVEKLLEIIMNSAVEILNAEAGSLLLTADDDSEDLIFRVVVGGGGEELVGNRIEAGQGVVGRVVSTSEPIIVNDDEADTILNVDSTAEFFVRTLLAVPLIAQDTAIGVLEVMNKKDGTPFTGDDSNLLRTLAGQAAVAIENARLFQQTDQQLSQRLRELETLERIDAELNRTQDLGEVANITVQQAMNILQADAGALGIVHTDPPYLEIVAIEGYSEGEYPPDAEGENKEFWRLDSGVVKRVMRSKQADITMDVQMDPDYEYGLDGSNSQLTLPMLTGNELNAILILEKNSEPRFSLPDWDFAKRIAEHASIALANAQFVSALSNAIESKSEFMGFAAHELKNPLASIKGYADVMLGGMTGELSDQQLDFMQVIKSNAERM
ncbi:MAG: GAF domain-containing protein, partial [Chloroflexota bacterium]